MADMKKIILTTLVVLLAGAQSIKAQDFEKFRFGLQASPLLGWLSPDVEDYESDGIKMGFNWGGMVEYYFAKHYALKSGFSLTSCGGKIKYKDIWKDKAGTIYPLGFLSRNYTIKYLEIPLGIKFKTNEIGYMTYFGHLGISSAFRTSAKSDDHYATIVTNVESIWNSRDAKEDISFFRESLIVGLGVEYGITTTTHLVGSLTYNNGFTDVLLKNNSNGKSHRAMSNYLELSIGILF